MVPAQLLNATNEYVTPVELTVLFVPMVKPLASSDWMRFVFKPVAPTRGFDTSPTIVDVRLVAAPVVRDLTMTKSGARPTPVIARLSTALPTYEPETTCEPKHARVWNMLPVTSGASTKRASVPGNTAAPSNSTLATRNGAVPRGGLGILAPSVFARPPLLSPPQLQDHPDRQQRRRQPLQQHPTGRS